MKYIVGAVAVILVAVLGIILILGRSNDDQAGERQVNVTDYADKDAILELTIQGRLVGQDDRRAIRITVSRTERHIAILRGYEETVERSQTFTNVEPAYTTFVRALGMAGFSRERQAIQTDERGVCPLGNRYIYILKDGPEQLMRLWSTSCGRDEGTFGGNANLIRQLFQNQIPDYKKIVSGVKL